MTIPALPLGRWRAALAGWSVDPGRRVLIVVAALCGAGWLGLHLSSLTVPVPAPALHLAWWMLAPVFAVAEMYVLTLQVRSEAQTVSLSEIPLALGLFFATPADLFAGRLLGAVAVFVCYRRQRPLKVTYNAALTFAGTAVALATYRLMLGDAAVLDPRSWLAMYAALAIAATLDALATTLVISFYEDRVRLRDVRGQIAPAMLAAVAVGTVAMTAAYALSADPRSAWALLACAALLFMAYRAYGSLRERHVSLGRLYGLSQAVGSSADVDGVLHSAVNQASELLRATRAEITFLPDGPDRPARTVRLGHNGPEGQRVLAALVNDVVHRGKPVLLPRRVRDPDLRRHLAKDDLRDAIVVPLVGDRGVLGALTVANRMGQVRTFDASDVRLLETIADHASVALAKRQLVDQLTYDAMHDALTGLPNRAALRGELDSALAEASASGHSRVAVIIMDLDGFKEVNDTLGHHHGDLLLQEVARRLLAAAPATASVARLGGDEFAVVLRGVAGPVQAEWQVRGLLAALESPCTLDGIAVEVRGSVGIAVAPDHGTEVAELLKRADIAMYAAKAHGRGVQGYEPTLRAAGPNHLSLSGELRSAIANEELVVYVQPQASLATGKVIAAEALVRWEHPRHGLLHPDDFIALAERTGLIKPLTLAVLDRALAANAEWRANGADVRINVNLSARSLSEPVLVAEIAALLQRHGVPATSLTLEITESTAVKEAGRSVELLHRLAAMGVRISIDDFGMGQSALAYLRRLPVSEIKIDKSFVIGMEDNRDNAAIVRAVVDLGASLSIDVVAEGVEERPVWDRLAGFGAAAAQGYFLARPMSLEEFPGWLKTYDPRRQLRWEGKGRGAA